MMSDEIWEIWEDGDESNLIHALDVAEADISLNAMSLSQCLEEYDVGLAENEFDDLAMELPNFVLDLNNVDMEFVFNDPEVMQLDIKPTGLQQAVQNDRFKLCDEKDIDLMKKNAESKNTRKNTNWSTTTFNDWRLFREEKTGIKIPKLENLTEADINCWLSKFVVEVRRKDGVDYPPRSLYQLCTGLLRYMRECGNHQNFLDEKNSTFYEFRKALSARMAELTAKGIGTVRRQADPVSSDKEQELWEKGILGDGSAKSLLNTVFFYNCKLFGLRGVDEHRNLCVEQLILDPGSSGEGPSITFNGRATKTYKGGLSQRNLTAKSVKHFFKDETLYAIYKQYLELIQTDEVSPEKVGIPFYRRALNSKSGKCFSQQCLGVNKLSTMMKDMCKEGGLKGDFTNHSGKRTCATALYQARVDEQEIMARTG